MSTDRRAYVKAHYEANKARYLERGRERKLRLARELAALKDHPCLDCGNRYPSCVMDFDHVRGEKVANIGNNATFLAELAKCELVCANCHRIRTQMRRNGGTDESRTR